MDMHHHSSTRSSGGRGNSKEIEGQIESVVVDSRGDKGALCKWSIPNFGKGKPGGPITSKSFDVGGYDCKLTVHPRGDGQSLPGQIAIYLELTDPKGTSGGKWDCLAGYRLSIVNNKDDSKTIQRDSCHRFASKRKSHGWCDFSPWAAVLDPKNGYIVNDYLLILAEISLLRETVSYTKQNEGTSSGGEMSSGKFTWKVSNLGMLRDMIRTQKMYSPSFPFGECLLRVSLQQVNSSTEMLSFMLESEIEKSGGQERSSWCFFRLTILNQKQGGAHQQRDHYGRFAADTKCGDSSSLGFLDYMKISDLFSPDGGFICNSSMTLTVSIHCLRESNTFSRILQSLGNRTTGRHSKGDGHQGRFVWKVENFRKLRKLLQGGNAADVCIKSRRFQVGNRDCRLIVYPMGQSDSSGHLALYMEVCDPTNKSSDWTCFVSHRSTLVNHKGEERSISKESQNRYFRLHKDWGWKEFLSFGTLLDADSGFLLNDTVTFTSEVLILKESFSYTEYSDSATGKDGSTANGALCKGSVPRLGPGTLSGRFEGSEGCKYGGGRHSMFTWKVENFGLFRETLESRKVFSKPFHAGGIETRLGMYESLDCLSIYLEAEDHVSPNSGLRRDPKLSIKHRVGLLNQKHRERSAWEETSVHTKQWTSTVLHFPKMSEIMDPDSGFVVRDSIVLVCEVLESYPKADSADDDRSAARLEQGKDLVVDACHVAQGSDSEGEDAFRAVLAKAGFHLSCNNNPPFLSDPSKVQVTLREKMLMDAGAVSAFITGLRKYLGDPMKAKKFLLPSQMQEVSFSPDPPESEKGTPSLMNLLMGVKVLQQAIMDLLLDIMVDCCCSSSDQGPRSSPAKEEVQTPQSNGSQSSVHWRPDLDGATSSHGFNPTSVINSAGVGSTDPPMAQDCKSGNNQSPGEASQKKMVWPEHAEELLSLVVSSLRALDSGAHVHSQCPLEPPLPRQPNSSPKFCTIMSHAPRQLLMPLIELSPKLVESSEHNLAARYLLARLKDPQADPALRLPTLKVLCEMELTSMELWKDVLDASLASMPMATDSALAYIINCALKSATECMQIQRAVRAVRARLRQLGPPRVSALVLLAFSSAVRVNQDLARAVLREIDSDQVPYQARLDQQIGDELQQRVMACWRVPDADILLDIMSLPPLRAEAMAVFERAVAKGAFGEHALLLVLERRKKCRLATYSTESAEREAKVYPSGFSFDCMDEEGDYSLLVGLAESLTLSESGRVRQFVVKFFSMIYGYFDDGDLGSRLLEGLVCRIDGNESAESELWSDILEHLMEEEDVAQPLMRALRLAFESSAEEQERMRQEILSLEGAIVKLREEKKVEVQRVTRERNGLQHKLSEAEASVEKLKAEVRLELDKATAQRKELTARMRDMETQLDWVRGEKEEESKKWVQERGQLQEKLRDAESQLGQLKVRKKEDAKKVTKEKQVLVDRVKILEGTLKAMEEQVNRRMIESQEAHKIVHELEAMKRRVSDAEDRAKDKDLQVRHYADKCEELESVLTAKQKYIIEVEDYVKVNMNSYSPLFGIGIEDRNEEELRNLANFHRDALDRLQEHMNRLQFQQGTQSLLQQQQQETHAWSQTQPTRPPEPGVGPRPGPSTMGSSHEVPGVQSFAMGPLQMGPQPPIQSAFPYGTFNYGTVPQYSSVWYDKKS